MKTGFSLTPYLESFTPTFGLGTPVFPRIFSNLHCGLLLFLKDVSGTPIFKILVRTLENHNNDVVFAVSPLFTSEDGDNTCGQRL